MFLSVLRSLWKNKWQIFALIFIVTSGGIIYSAFNSINYRLNESYKSLEKNSNVNNAILDLNTSSLQSNSDSLNNLQIPNNYLNGLVAGCNKAGISSDDFNASYFDTRNFNVENFNNDGIECNFKVISYNQNPLHGIVNKPKLVAGNLPKQKTPGENNEITLTPDFAKMHHIKLNQMVEINKSMFKVSGFAYAPNFSYQQISLDSGIPNNNNTSIVYANSNDIFRATENIFNPVSIADREVYISFYFSNSKNIDRTISKLNQVLNNPAYTYENEFNQQKTLNSIFPYDQTTSHIVSPYSSQYDFNQRVGLIDTIQKFNFYVCYGFMLFIIGISSILLFVLALKRIESDRKLIGTFKSFGYTNKYLFSTYLAYPFIISTGGSILGWGLSFAIQPSVASLYYNTFTLPSTPIDLSWWTLLVAFVISFVFLAGTTIIAFLFRARSKPVELLYNK